MDTVFLVCALIGGTLIACQFLLSLLGFAGEHDAADHGGDHDAGGHDGGAHDHGNTEHSSTWFFSMLTVRTVAAALAFFGLTGLAAHRAELDELPTTMLAVAAGVAAFFLVGYLMRFLHKLNVDGTVRIERAIGCRGSVYLSIPGAKAGVGKVLVNVQSRSVEYQALTAQQDLPTGMPIVVVGVVGPDTVEVAAALDSAKAVG
jgi:hypothetical protein